MTKGKSTLCVHSGSFEDKITKGVNTPIFTSSAYDYEEVDALAYPRYNNTVNQQAVAEKIRALENGEDALVFSSGMAAIMTALFAVLKTGDHAVIQKDIYGGSFDALTTELDRYGIELTFVKGHTKEDFQSAIQENTRLIFIETPSNPLLKIVDVRAVAELGNEQIVTMIDNTFSSPVNQNPIDMGIDIVMHSATKYLGGHSDILAGALISSKTIMAKIKNTAIHIGGSLDAHTCYLLERSIKTLLIRVERQNANAQSVAEFLENHPKVEKVYYPGLSSHDGHEIALKQMKGFGGMISFETKENAEQLLEKLQMIKRAISLGGVESTVCLPVKTSHSKVSPEERAKMGIKDNLIRLSVGIEDDKDIIQDLKQALE
ncbi:MAG: trans-sulfuration enzyme family protein [Candidatus Cyclobacteriaceae bacterium M2_1C_046]